MSTLLQDAQKLINRYLLRTADALRANLSSEDFEVGNIGSWSNENGMLNSHLVLSKKSIKEAVECIIGLKVSERKAEMSADICLQDGTILYAVGDYILSFSSDAELLNWIDRTGPVISESFFRYFTSPMLEKKQP
jgi:hypothetical protein